MKKLMIYFLLVSVLLSFASPALATGEIKVYVDNRLLQLEDPPFIQDGRTLVPMRAFFEALGARVDWEPETQTAVGRRGGVTVRIPIGSTRPTVNGRIEQIDVAAQIVDSRTYIPLRFVGEALGDDVHWDGDTRSIAITRVEATNGVPGKRDEQEPVESLSVWLEADREVVPAGGGQAITLSVTVADDQGYLVEGAQVNFFAEAFEAGERNAQFSQSEVTTDAQGEARVTYTTLAGDDRRFVTINVSVSKDIDDYHFMEFRSLQVVAADQVANVRGVVNDPFTGAPLEGIHIVFQRADLDQRSIGFVETDAQGRYAAVVPTGYYSIWFNLEIRDEIAVHLSSPGETYTVDNKKGILKGVVTGVPPGESVMAIGPGFRRTDPANWTLTAKIQQDGSFMMALFPNTYDIMVMHPSGPPPFKRGVTIQSGQVTDLGTVRGR